MILSRIAVNRKKNVDIDIPTAENREYFDVTWRFVTRNSLG